MPGMRAKWKRMPLAARAAPRHVIPREAVDDPPQPRQRVLPLAIATGAGAAAQNSIGIGVMGGMMAATFLGIFLVPGFYVAVRRLTGDRPPRQVARAAR